MEQEKFLSRREFLYGASAAGLGLILAACAPVATPEPVEEEPEEAASPAMEEATIVYWSWAESNFPHFEHMVDLWNEQNADGPKLTFDGVLVPSSEETITKGMNAMAAGSGVPDVLLVEISHFSKFLKDDPPLCEQYLTNFVPALDEYNGNWQDDYIGFAPYTWEGKVYGFEVGLCPTAYYYRQDLFEEVGIEMPLETWEDWMAAGEKMLDAGHAMVAFDTSSLNEFIMEFYQAGGQLFDPNGAPAIEEERAYKTMELIISAAQSGIRWQTTEYWGPPHYAALNDGTVAGVISAIWYSPHVLKPNIDEVYHGLWRVQPMPTWTTSGPWGGPTFETRKTSTWGGTSLTIPKQSEHPELTFDYMAFAMLSEAGGASVYQNMGQMPMVKSVIHDDSVTDIPDDFYGGQAINKVFADIADDIPPKFPNPFWNEAEQALNKQILPALENEGTYEELIAIAADEIREQIANA